MSIIPVILKIPKEFFRGSRQISAVNSVGGTVCQKRPVRSDFDMQYKENGSAPLLSETPMRLLLPPVRSCVPPWRQDGIRNPGGAEQGRVGAVCPALARCPGSHPRPVCATSPERFAPPMREKWTVEKSAGKTIPHLLAVRRALVPPVLARPGNAVLPTHGWDKQSACPTLSDLAPPDDRRSGRKPGPTLSGSRAEGQREGKQPLFGRVRGCVPSFGEGQSPCPSWRVWAGFGALFAPLWKMALRPLARFRGTNERAGERTGAFVAPVLSQLPAVRAVAGF